MFGFICVYIYVDIIGMQVCLCMCVCMYARIYACMDGWMDGWMDVRTYVRMYIRMYVPYTYLLQDKVGVQNLSSLTGDRSASQSQELNPNPKLKRQTPNANNT